MPDVTTPLPPLHDPGWLADVCLPGPNGQHFGAREFAPLAAATTFIMEDDTQVSLFTPGCGAYAGYSSGTFSNMTQVRAYAAAQHAHAFAYTGHVGQLSGADALDIEPGLAAVSDAVTAYKGGIRYFYGSASWVSQITSALAAGGVPRANYKIISAHYIGSHICGPGTCGYPQANATQFTSSYLGRSLDATLCPADFLGAVVIAPPPPAWPLVLGSSGSQVYLLQLNLNRWAAVLKLKPLIPDASFGPLTAAAVTLAQQHFGESGVPAGQCTQAVFNDLAQAVPPPPPPPPPPSTRIQYEYYKPGFGWVFVPDSTVTVPRSPKIRVRASNSAWSDWTENIPG